MILADEPTGNLDSNNSTQVMELLKQLNQEGATIVMVTHAPEHVNFGTRVIELLDGKVCRDHMITGHQRQQSVLTNTTTKTEEVACV